MRRQTGLRLLLVATVGGAGAADYGAFARRLVELRGAGKPVILKVTPPAR